MLYSTATNSITQNKASFSDIIEKQSEITMRIRRCRCGAYIFIRGFHTVLVLGIATSLIVEKTALSEALHDWTDPSNVSYSLSFLALLLFSLVMYYVTCLVDPGYVPINKRRPWDSDDEDEELETTTMLRETEEGTRPAGIHGNGGHGHNNSSVKLRKCGFCEIEQPLRSHHCEDCGHCVRRYDHHCPWLEACVGERNHKYFWMFLVSMAMLVLWAASIVWHAFEYHLLWSTWFRANILMILDSCVLLSAGVTVVGLSAFHTYLMCSNQTTWEVASRERITYLKHLGMEANPFHEGYCRNTLTFLCTMGARKWDALYKKYVAATKNVES